MTKTLRERQAEASRAPAAPGFQKEDAEKANRLLDARNREAERRLNEQIREATRSRTRGRYPQSK